MNYKLLGLLFALVAYGVPPAAREAHLKADAVLYPELIARMNEFALDHGSVEAPGHFDKLDAKDVKHIEAVRKAFASWDSAMKTAGY